TEKTGDVIGVKAVNQDDEVMIITTEGIIIRIMVSDISVLGRITSGVKLISIDSDSNISVASMAKVRENEKSTNEEIIKNLEKELDEVDSDAEIIEEEYADNDDYADDQSEEDFIDEIDEENI